MCRHCGEHLIRENRGPAPTYCSTRCRVAAHRARKRIPAELTKRGAWTRRDGKRPIRPDGRPASSRKAETWASFAAVQSGAGDGFGIMLGDGLGCFDLDHVTDEEIRAFLATVDEPVIYVERSMSGEGAHIFVATDERRGYRHPNHEFYSWARFIAVTGQTFT